MFGLEAARLFVSVGVNGMDLLVSEMNRGKAIVDAVGNTEATVLVGQAGADQVISKLEHTKSKMEEVGRAKAEPSVRVTGVDAAISKLDHLRAKLTSLAQGGSLGSFAQDISLGRGLLPSLRGVGGAIGAGMSTGGFGGGIAAGASALGPIGLAAGAIAAISGFGLGKAAEQERFQTQLSVLLGSVEAAKKRIAELTQFAATTPFELPEVVNASKTLQVFTGDALSSGNALRLIGDVAAGTGSNFGETAMWFGRMYDALKSGRPFGEATMRLQEMGALSGKSREKIEQLAEAVKNGSMTMEQAWPQVAEQFGRFGGMMEKQSMTLEGKLSNLSDAFGQAGAKLGTLLLPVAKLFVDALIVIVTAIGNVIGLIGDFVGWIGDLAKGFLDFVNSMPAVQDALKLFGDALKFIGDAVDFVTGAIGDGWDYVTGKTEQMARETAARTEMTTAEWYKNFREGERNISYAVEGIADKTVAIVWSMKNRVVRITDAMVNEMAAKLREDRAAWQAAWDSLQGVASNSMSVTVEIAAIKGKLAKIAMSDGWKSGDPVWIAALVDTRNTLETRLAELERAGGKSVEKMLDRMGAILRSPNSASSGAARAAERLADKFEALPGRAYDWAAALLRQYAQGLADNRGRVIHQALMVSAKVAAIMRLRSPAQEGPLSEGGGPEGWGQRFAFLYAKGLESNSFRLRSILEDTVNVEAPGRSEFGRSGGRGFHGGETRANGLTVIIHNIDARGSTDPGETERKVRRGVMDTVAMAYRQQNARLPAGVRA